MTRTPSQPVFPRIPIAGKKSRGHGSCSVTSPYWYFSCFRQTSKIGYFSIKQKQQKQNGNNNTPIIHCSHTYNLDAASGNVMCIFSFLLLFASIKSPECLYFFINVFRILYDYPKVSKTICFTLWYYILKGKQ